jgi:hypothetical protein
VIEGIHEYDGDIDGAYHRRDNTIDDLVDSRSFLIVVSGGEPTEEVHSMNNEQPLVKVEGARDVKEHDRAIVEDT